jgi:peptide/nickel transport system permease protein
MIGYIIKRIFYMVPTLMAISLVTFLIIQLPPGDFLSTYITARESEGEIVDPAEIDALRQRYGLGQPIVIQYFVWVGNVLQGDFGQSFQHRRPVSDLIWERLALTMALSTGSILLTWAIAFPVGIYSAVKQYSIGDYVFTTIGFIGMSIPNFLFALILMVGAFKLFNISVGGLFSPDYATEPWSWGKFVDLLEHIWIPIIVIGIGATAGQIRIMRANLLDELHRPYVTTARAKGQSELLLLARYPVREALNPFVSGIGNVLPALVSGSIIVAIVLSLPTTGPLLLGALRSQDMYLAGTLILMVSVLTVIGTLISDILLAWLDPRIRVSMGNK